MALTEETTLSHTPTYQAAAVVILFAGISIVVEKILHRLGAYLKRKKRRHLFNALERIKEELMLLGFISILLTLFSTEIAKICVPFSKSNPMLFCKYESYSSNSTAHESNTQESHNTENASSPSPSSSESTSDSHSPPTGRRLLETFVMSSLTNPSLSSLPSSPSRLFARKLMSSEASTCKEGYESFVNTEGLHQLHNFIFFIAVFQVLYAVLTMFLAIVRIHTWKEWEEEAKALSIACVEKDIKARFNSFYTRRSSSVGRLTSVFSFGISKSKKDEVMHEIEKPDSSCCHSFLKKITTFLVIQHHVILCALETNAYTNAYVNACTNSYVNAYTNAFVDAYTSACANAYAYAYVEACMHAHTNTYAYVYGFSCANVFSNCFCFYNRL